MLDYIDQNPEKYPGITLGELMFFKTNQRKKSAQESYQKHNAQSEQEKIEAILRDNPKPDECAMILLDGYGNHEEIKKYYRSISHTLSPAIADHIYKTTRYDSPMFYVTYIAYSKK